MQVLDGSPYTLLPYTSWRERQLRTLDSVVLITLLAVTGSHAVATASAAQGLQLDLLALWAPFLLCAAFLLLVLLPLPRLRPGAQHARSEGRTGSPLQQPHDQTSKSSVHVSGAASSNHMGCNDHNGCSRQSQPQQPSSNQQQSQKRWWPWGVVWQYPAWHGWATRRRSALVVLLRLLLTSCYAVCAGLVWSGNRGQPLADPTAQAHLLHIWVPFQACMLVVPQQQLQLLTSCVQCALTLFSTVALEPLLLTQPKQLLAGGSCSMLMLVGLPWLIASGHEPFSRRCYAAYCLAAAHQESRQAASIGKGSSSKATAAAATQVPDGKARAGGSGDSSSSSSSSSKGKVACVPASPSRCSAASIGGGGKVCGAGSESSAPLSASSEEPQAVGRMGLAGSALFDSAASHKARLGVHSSKPDSEEPAAHSASPWPQLARDLEELCGLEVASSILAAAGTAKPRVFAYQPVVHTQTVSIKVQVPHDNISLLEPPLRQLLFSTLQQGAASNGPVLAQAVCVAGCVQLLASVYHIRGGSTASTGDNPGLLNDARLLALLQEALRQHSPASKGSRVDTAFDASTHSSSSSSSKMSRGGSYGDVSSSNSNSNCCFAEDAVSAAAVPIEIAVGETAVALERGLTSTTGARLQQQGPTHTQAAAVRLLFHDPPVFASPGSSCEAIGAELPPQPGMTLTLALSLGSGQADRLGSSGFDSGAGSGSIGSSCRVLVFTEQQVVLDAVQLLQPTMRITLPVLGVGTYYLALLPHQQAAMTDPPARRALDTPLLLRPLVVLPEPAASEVQQLWVAVCAMLEPGRSAAAGADARPSGDSHAGAGGQHKADAWCEMMSGLLQDIAVVVACHNSSGTLLLSAEPQQQQQTSVKPGSCSGSAAAGPGGRHGAMGVDAMVALQGLLDPLLHFLAIHHMWSTSSSLVRLLRSSIPVNTASVRSSAAAVAACGMSGMQEVDDDEVGSADVQPTGVRRRWRAVGADRVDAQCALEGVACGADDICGPGMASQQGSSSSCSSFGDCAGARKGLQPQQESCGVEGWSDAAAGRSGAGAATSAPAQLPQQLQWELGDRWGQRARQLCRGFRSPLLEAAYLQYIYQHNGWLDLVTCAVPLLMSWQLLEGDKLSTLEMCWSRGGLACRVQLLAQLVFVASAILLAVLRPWLNGFRREVLQGAGEWGVAVGMAISAVHIDAPGFITVRDFSWLWSQALMRVVAMSLLPFLCRRVRVRMALPAWTVTCTAHHVRWYRLHDTAPAVLLMQYMCGVCIACYAACGLELVSRRMFLQMQVRLVTAANR